MSETAEAATPEEKPDPVLEGRFIAACPGQKGIHVKADDAKAATALVCKYLGCEPKDVVVAKAKKSSGPKRGDRVLRSEPAPGSKDKDSGYVYGLERA